MAILAIRIYPDHVLRVKCRPVETFDAGLRKLAANMVDTMHAAPASAAAGGENEGEEEESPPQTRTSCSSARRLSCRFDRSLRRPRRWSVKRMPSRWSISWQMARAR